MIAHILTSLRVNETWHTGLLQGIEWHILCSTSLNGCNSQNELGWILHMERSQRFLGLHLSCWLMSIEWAFLFNGLQMLNSHVHPPVLNGQSFSYYVCPFTTYRYIHICRMKSIMIIELYGTAVHTKSHALHRISNPILCTYVPHPIVILF